MKTNRRTLLAVAAALLSAPAWAARGPRVEVWKSPSCGCCKDWVAHMREAGFEVVVHETGNTAVRARLGIAQRYGSCHTALVQGYAIEGHVPAQDVERLLRLRPKALGLAVPGMPIGSPGMDGPEYGGRRDPYDVLLLRADAAPVVFRAVRPA
ncbi:MAG: DUF411 domain-containing protein [Rubrivivax sp.]